MAEATINWLYASQVATSVSIVISTASLVSGFLIYNIKKRNEYLKAIRSVILAHRENCQRLDRLITQDVLNELASAVVYSVDMEPTVKKMYIEYFAKPKGARSGLRELLDSGFPPIVLSIHTPLLNQFEIIASENIRIAATLYHDYPGLYRILRATSNILGKIMDNAKGLVRDEKAWTKILRAMAEQKNRFSDLAEFKRDLVLRLVAIESRLLKEKDQLDIDDLLEILGLTTSAYLRSGNWRLYRQMRLEKGTQMVPIGMPRKATDNLFEASKVLRKLLSAEEMIQYTILCRRFEERNR